VLTRQKYYCANKWAFNLFLSKKPPINLMKEIRSLSMYIHLIIVLFHFERKLNSLKLVWIKYSLWNINFSTILKDSKHNCLPQHPVNPCKNDLIYLALNLISLPLFLVKKAKDSSTLSHIPFAVHYSHAFIQSIRTLLIPKFPLD
jgi:hypothetical protein